MSEIEQRFSQLRYPSTLSNILFRLTPVLKASIVARVNNPLGFVQFAPRKELLATQDHLLDLVCRGLAGKASQVIFFDKHTDQAHKDLKRITDVSSQRFQRFLTNQ